MLAEYAIPDDTFGGRTHREPRDPIRGPFAVDRLRIIQCTAFRRLAGKTQVFAPGVHDHFRTRLTHTIEAAQMARTLALVLGVNEALAEAITLAHDLGHPPFGHAGEAALTRAMARHGGFNHNAHSLRVVEQLEHPYPAFRGLNLCHATLAGLRHHVTRYDAPAAGPTDDRGPSIEAEVASWADRLAYNVHDLEDAIGAGFIGKEDLQTLSLGRKALESIDRKAASNLHSLRRPFLDAVVDHVLGDVVSTSRVRLHGLGATPAAGRVAPSDGVEASLCEWERLLAERVYRRPEIQAADRDGQSMIETLFAAYLESPSRLPQRFAGRIADQGPHRVICDYIAGMTDGFCRGEFMGLSSARTPSIPSP